MSNLGLGGLVSGMNTDDIITKLEQFEQAQIDDQARKQADILAKQTAWGKVNDSLTSLRGALDQIRFAGMFHSRLATLSDATVADVSVDSTATIATHQLTVAKLALAHTQSLGSALSLTSTTSAVGVSGNLTFSGASLTGGPVTVTVAATDTLSSLRDKINTANAGVTADLSKDPGTGDYTIVLTDKATGTANDITVADGPGLGLTNLQSAQDASFTLDGNPYTSATNAITGLVQGATITLKKDGGASSSISIGQNGDAVANAVAGWVDAVNGTISLLADQTKYDSTTGASGVLNGDSLARSLQTSLKGMMSAIVPNLPGNLDTLSDVGITTGAWGTANYGKVLLDKTKLESALASSEDGVAKLFGAMRNSVASSVGWTSAGVPTPSTPQELVLDLGGNKSIDEISLSIPNGMSSSPTTGLKDFSLYYMDGSGSWQQIQNVTSFVGSSAVYDFNAVNASQVKLVATSTYDGLAAQVSGMQANATDMGVAYRMYQYVNSTLDTSDGIIQQRNSGYSQQISDLDKKITDMKSKMATHIQQLKAQFDQMEQSMQQLQAQGSQMMAMLGGSPSSSGK